MKMNFAKTRFYLSTRFRLILLAGSALTLILFGPGVAVAAVVAVSDFNGDGHPDFVLQGGAGLQQTGIWYMNNNDFVGALFGPTLPGLMWAVVGTGDFNGDGHPDYVVENIFTGQTGIWYMDNNEFVGALFGPTLPVGWVVRAVGDFNGDGHPDFVLQGGLGGQQTGIWYLNNNVFVGALSGPTLPVGWSLRIVGPSSALGSGVRDFNGD